MQNNAFGGALNSTVSMSATYPRGDFVRTNLSWMTLNGPWDFIFDDNDIGLSEGWHQQGIPGETPPTQGGVSVPNNRRTIEVPFIFQSKASGINEQGVHEVLWYERTIRDLRRPGDLRGHRLLLRFGAVDYIAQVWLSGLYIGSHRGGHVPFDLDLTDAAALLQNMGMTAGYRLTIRVYDSAYDTAQPRGKQYWKPVPEAIWYTPSSGIWQNVWLESVPRLRIGDSSSGTILRAHDIEGGQLDARVAVLGRRAGENCSVGVVVTFAGLEVATSGRRRLSHDEDFVRFDVNMRLSEQQTQQMPEDLLKDTPIHDRSCWRNGVALWSPEHPTLYNITIRLFGQDNELLDEVNTTTGMRSLSWTTGDGTFRLNGQPYFQALFLDQGYWPDTLLTPPTPEAARKDIELSKAMGFNGCRKHQKVEDPSFMYWADRLGFLVWGEMASCHRFSNDMVDRFDQEWMEMVQRDINHPCIVAWTPQNESWGYPNLDTNVRQRDHLRSLYYRTKTLDWTRPINDNCGWEHVATDLSTFHAYKDGPGMAERCASIKSVLGIGKEMFVFPIHGTGGEFDKGARHERGMPILCTELGGVNISATTDPEQKENWGYTTASDSKDLLDRVGRIMMGAVQSGVVCGIVWTQLTDIEQEQNGLYTWDRRPKLPPDQVKAIMDRARETYHSARL